MAKADGVTLLSEPPVAVAYATPVPVVQYTTPVVGPGNGFLLTSPGLYVRQSLEVFELITGCETKNRYSFTPITQPIPPSVNSGWAAQYRSMAMTNPFLKAKEESECFERICCPLFRGFTMDFKDGAGTNFLTIDRPFKCDPCYMPPMCMCNTQELAIATNGAVVARAKETTGLCFSTGCCSRQFETYDTSGRLLYTLEVNDCVAKTGGSTCNCLAPSLCNEELTVDVKAANGSYVAPSTFIWPGCNCGGLTDLTNMVIAFPDGATADERSAILAGMMLIEFSVMEMRRQNQKDNGGGGGGAPPAQEMKR